MIPNCRGCNYELEDAYYWQTQGYHLATCIDLATSENVWGKGHFGMIIVNDEGKVVMW